MTRLILALTAAVTATGMAAAQAPLPAYGTPTAGVGPAGIPPSVGVAPVLGAGVSPPLSPYLNLLRGGNPAINYFYGVRPWEAANAYQRSAAQAAPAVAFSQARNGFIPAAGTPSDAPTEVPPAGQPVTLSSSGHPVVFGNRFGTMTGGYPGTVGARSATTGAQPGYFGNSPPQAFNRTNPTGGGQGQPGATIPRIR